MVFVSSRSVKLRELSFAQFVDFLGESVFIFQFLNDEINNYVKQNITLNDKIYNYVKHNIIVNFFIQKLKNKRTFP